MPPDDANDIRTAELVQMEIVRRPFRMGTLAIYGREGGANDILPTAPHTPAVVHLPPPRHGMPLPARRFLDIGQAAEYVGVGVDTFRQEVEAGMWPGPVRRGKTGRAVTWDVRALDAAADRLAGIAAVASVALATVDGKKGGRGGGVGEVQVGDMARPKKHGIKKVIRRSADGSVLRTDHYHTGSSLYLGTDLDEALRRAAEIDGDTKPEPPPTSVFEGLAAAYLTSDAYRRLAPKSQKLNALYIGKLVKRFGGLDVHGITRPVVVAFREKLSKEIAAAPKRLPGEKKPRLLNLTVS